MFKEAFIPTRLADINHYERCVPPVACRGSVVLLSLHRSIFRSVVLDWSMNRSGWEEHLMCDKQLALQRAVIWALHI